MTRGLLFWIIMLLELVYGLHALWPSGSNYYPLGGHLILWVLLALLGSKVFGPPIQG